MWLAFDASMFKEFQLLFETELLGRKEVRFDTDPKSARLRLRQRLVQIADRFADRQWLVGESFTAADAAIAVSLKFFPQMGVAWQQSFPVVADWHRRVIDRPSFARLRELVDIPPMQGRGA